MWTNCALNNRKEDYVGKVGARADGCFERLWAATGYEAGARIRRRATAGIAAPKYEPAAEPLEKKAPQRNATSGKSLRNGAQARPRGRPAPPSPPLPFSCQGVDAARWARPRAPWRGWLYVNMQIGLMLGALEQGRAAAVAAAAPARGQFTRALSSPASPVSGLADPG